MASRNCHLMGNIRFRADIGDASVENMEALGAMNQAVTECREELRATGGLTPHSGYFHLHLIFDGEGSVGNPHIVALADSLARVASGGGYLEVLDLSAPDQARTRFPYFFGPDAASRDQARTEYDAMWRKARLDKLRELKAEGLTLEDCMEVFRED